MRKKKEEKQKRSTRTDKQTKWNKKNIVFKSMYGCGSARYFDNECVYDNSPQNKKAKYFQHVAVSRLKCTEEKKIFGERAAVSASIRMGGAISILDPSTIEYMRDDIIVR